LNENNATYYVYVYDDSTRTEQLLSYYPLEITVHSRLLGRSVLGRSTGRLEPQILLGLVHTFRFSPGRQVPLIAGQSSGTQESIGVFTQPGHLAGRLPGSTRIHPLLCPVAGR